jgi:hypothetical protein
LFHIYLFLQIHFRPPRTSSKKTIWFHDLCIFIGLPFIPPFSTKWVMTLLFLPLFIFDT